MAKTCEYCHCGPAHADNCRMVTKPLVVLELEKVLKQCIPVTCLPMNYADYDALAMAIVLELYGKAAIVDVQEYRRVMNRLARYELLADAIRAIQADK